MPGPPHCWKAYPRLPSLLTPNSPFQKTVPVFPLQPVLSQATLSQLSPKSAELLKYPLYTSLKTIIHPKLPKTISYYLMKSHLTIDKHEDFFIFLKALYFFISTTEPCNISVNQKYREPLNFKKHVIRSLDVSLYAS